MKIWIYADGRQQGPFDTEQPAELKIDATTPVWYDGLDRWKPAGQCPELQQLLSGDGNCRAESDSQSDKHADEAPIRPAAPAPAPKRPAPAPAPAPAAAASAASDDECPPTYIGWSVFLTICCCSPLSIGALIASICVGTAWNGGRHGQARKASQWAAWLIMCAIALGFLPMMLISALMP